MNLEEITKVINADVTAILPALRSAEVTGFAIDSRTVKAGDLFFALSQPDYKNNGFNGDFADSHEFIPSAFEKGAIACVARLDKVDGNAVLEKFRNKILFVPDCIRALQDLARAVYQNWNKPVVAVTGSAGKTSAKQLAAQVLEQSGRRVLTNFKNYNNGLGHPLTVLRLLTEGEFDVAVLEMAMSTPMHEIARLCQITPPDVAVELNVLPVHIEHLGTIERIAQAKAELVEGMKPGGTAVLNADDFRVSAMRDLSKGKTITYGIKNEADIMAKNIRFERFGETRFTLATPSGNAEVLFPLNGKHNIMNALSAVAVGLCFGMSVEEIAKALEAVQPPAQRGEVHHFPQGFTVIDDSYNSNPDALLLMVQTIVEGGTGAKRKIVVAGEMRELGEGSERMHFETGEKIGTSGIDVLFGVEGFAEKIVAGAKSKGLENVGFYENSEVAAEKFPAEIRPGDLILIKGSRGVKTEKILEKISEKFSSA